MLRIIFGYLFFLILQQECFAFYPAMGITASYPAMVKDPNQLHGSRFSVWIQPPCWDWHRFQLYLDTSYAYWKVSGASENASIVIYALAPVFRGFITQSTDFSTYFEATIAPCYMTRTRISDRNLGIHFAFQDAIGLGALLGSTERFSVNLSAYHYSNAALCHINAGITIPIMLTLGYRFS